MEKYLYTLALGLLLAQLPGPYVLAAADLNGKVVEVSSNVASVQIEGTLMPKAGDPAKIFFTLGGTEEVSVASGRVQSVSDSSVELKIGNATGEVVKGQLVRINSPNPQPRTTTAPVAAAPELPPRRGKLLLEDDGDSPKDLLQVPGNSNVNGERRIIANAGTSRNRGYNLETNDFFVRCTVRGENNPEECYPMILFRTSTGDGEIHTYYELAIGADACGLTKIIDRMSTTPERRQYPGGAHVSVKQKMAVGLEVIGNQFRVFLDDHWSRLLPTTRFRVAQGFRSASLITRATVPVLSIMTRSAFTRPLERFQSRARKSLPAASASIGI
jgi:hypothetical protein